VKTIILIEKFVSGQKEGKLEARMYVTDVKSY